MAVIRLGSVQSALIITSKFGFSTRYHVNALAFCGLIAVNVVSIARPATLSFKRFSRRTGEQTVYKNNGKIAVQVLTSLNVQHRASRPAGFPSPSLLVTQTSLNCPTKRAIWIELLSNRTLFIKWSTNLLGCASYCTLGWNKAGQQ